MDVKKILHSRMRWIPDPPEENKSVNALMLLFRINLIQQK
jgi:hypothetical protein